MKLYIARDGNGNICLYREKPSLLYDGDEFDMINKKGENILVGILDFNDFPEVTFDNSPQQVELKLIIE